jgi:thymidylate synthase ThyX
MISAKIIADSVAPNGRRITTIQATMPRFILAEFNTHRVFSRNSASSRAIPVIKLLEKVRTDPTMPLYYAYNQSGMQAAGLMTATDALACEQVILDLRDRVLQSVQTLTNLNLHKQWANRYLEPFMEHTVIVTSTEWDNFFVQRISTLAQPEIDDLAAKMYNAMLGSDPMLVNYGEWHLPYIQEDERETLPLDDLVKISAARCARVSYLTQEGVRDHSKDLEMYDKLVSAKPPHWSPLEHVATPWRPRKLKFWTKPLGNFEDWSQLRHNSNWKGRKWLES